MQDNNLGPVIILLSGLQLNKVTAKTTDFQLQVSTFSQCSGLIIAANLLKC